MKNFYFLTLNNGEKEGGATVRIKGILNALANNNQNVYLFSNIKDYHTYHPSIKHIPLNIDNTHLDKLVIQWGLANVGVKFVNIYFNKYLIKFNKIFKDYNIDTLISFEYIDNSIAYWLWKNKIIKNYVNDIHGVAGLEFLKSFNIAPIYLKPWFKIKYYTAMRLDKKVLANSKFNIFTSEAMKEHFSGFIPQIKDSIIIPNLINPHNYVICKDYSYVNRLFKENNINTNKKILFFIGSFKKTSGVIQLIKIAKNLKSKVELIIVGNGPLYSKSIELVKSENINNVYLLGVQPYDYLNCFHQMTDIMICPDEDNPFSHMIIHIKYLDALMSNKPVINANFKSVQELNKEDHLSISYQASNYKELEEKINTLVNNYELYLKKYNNNREVICKNMSYSSYIDKLIKVL